ncbi:MAG: hypothetical protein IT442_01170 [Phycisphaeraceae bacterium]|nr:hypothetical protein [Phycisphaeraceae bacterium]
MKNTLYWAAAALGVMSSVQAAGQFEVPVAPLPNIRPSQQIEEIESSIGPKLEAQVMEQPVVQQRLPRFNKPESCAFSLDGRFLYVTNCASGEHGPGMTFGLLPGEGAISKLAVGSEGNLKVVDLRWATGLTAPLGITVLPVPTDRFPAGSLFINVGFYMQCDNDGTPVTDPRKWGTGVIILDGESGELLGKIDCGPDGPVVKALGRPIFGLNGATFDKDGHFYAAEVGSPDGKTPPGILRLSHHDLDALTLTPVGASSDASQTIAGVAFTPFERGPNGLAYDETTDAIYFVTSDGPAPKGGAVYAIPRGAFPLDPNQPKLAPIVDGLGSLDGLVFTPAGHILVSRSGGDLALIRSGQQPQTLELGSPPVKFRSPSDIKLHKLDDDSAIVVIPEQDAKNKQGWTQRVSVLRLPAGW